MKINFIENKTLLIESNFKTYSFESNDISKIYISCTSFVFLKKYRLNIHTKQNELKTFVFFSNDKEVVKNAVFKVKSNKYLEINTK